MHVSPAVRSIRDEPIEGETVTLLIEVADDYDPGGDPVEAVADGVAGAGGTVTDRRPFGTLAVEVPHEQVGAVCEVAGIGLVETDNATTIDPDGAGEDVEYDV